jgi:hypothetical protein
MIQKSTKPQFWDVETRQSRLTLEEFDEHVQSYVRYITESCQTLYLSAAPFSSYERNILPVQIREVRHSLKEMLKPTQEFSWLIHDTDRLPIIYTGLRYRLLAILNIIEEQISRCLDLLHTYQISCISPSEGEKWLRSEIYNTFESLLQFTMTFSERVKLVRDEAEKQESKLLLLYENY